VLNFGASAPQTLTVTNVGTRPLQIGGVTTSEGFAIEGNACLGRPIAVGSGCQITVRFAPQTIGGLSGTLTIVSNAPSSPDSVSLSGSNCPLLPPTQRRFVPGSCAP
jgi:hypothetical protein